MSAWNLSLGEEKAVETFEAYLKFAQLRLGFNLHVGPNQTRDEQDWLLILKK